jgi:hypothetical protein
MLNYRKKTLDLYYIYSLIALFYPKVAKNGKTKYSTVDPYKTVGLPQQM